MSEPVQVFYKGQDTDFIVMGQSVEAVEKYRKDPSYPLVSAVALFHVLRTRTGGSEGIKEHASAAELENEFGTSDEDEVIKKILREGIIKENTKIAGKSYSSTNDSKGPLAGH